MVFPRYATYLPHNLGCSNRDPEARERRLIILFHLPASKLRERRDLLWSCLLIALELNQKDASKPSQTVFQRRSSTRVHEPVVAAHPRRTSSPANVNSIRAFLRDLLLSRPTLTLGCGNLGPRLRRHCAPLHGCRNRYSVLWRATPPLGGCGDGTRMNRCKHLASVLKLCDFSVDL